MSGQQENELGLIWVKYKIRKIRIGGVRLKVSLEVNVQTREVTGFTYLYRSNNPRLNKISCIKGHYANESTVNSGCVLFVIQGSEISSLGVESEENIKVKMFLRPDLLSGTASFEYLVNGNWYKYECYKVKVAKSIGSNVKELAFHVNDKAYT